MKIDKITSYQYNVQSIRNNAVNFGMASDITIEYALKHHSKYLPQSMIKRIRELVHSGQGKKRIYEVHNEVYKDLFEAETLDELRGKYAEFENVKGLELLANNRSKAVKAVLKLMPLEKFTLGYLKKLYRPTSQDKLKEEYGFTNRSLLAWLNEKLNIKKLSGSYIQLLKMSDDTENSRIAELSRRAIYANAEAQKYRLEKAAETHRTPEYREKKRREMKEYYVRHPEMAQKTSRISKMTWDRCPEIKEAFSSYTKLLSPYIRKVLSKKQAGCTLNETEHKIATSYYRDFWAQNPQFKPIYRARRLEVIEELKKD